MALQTNAEADVSGLVRPFDACVSSIHHVPQFEEVRDAARGFKESHTFDVYGVQWRGCVEVQVERRFRPLKRLRLVVPTDGVRIIDPYLHRPPIPVVAKNDVDHQPRGGEAVRVWFDVVLPEGLGLLWDYLINWFPEDVREAVVCRALLCSEAQRLDMRCLLTGGDVDVEYTICFEPGYPEPRFDPSAYHAPGARAAKRHRKK